ncbi:MAG: hypothetical protein IPK33_26260 [Gemmatimonadetes bacterium]|nr:hypothetical protein [Gemmatimonadota bacterium]
MSAAAEPTDIDLRKERLALFAVTALVLVVAVLTIAPWPVGAFQDDAIYTVLAKALATGEGFRLINLPGSPHNTHYPPGYPLVLAALWKLWPAFPDNIVLFKFANAFFLAAAAAGTWLFTRERLDFRPWQAAVTAIVGTLSVTVLLVTGVVLSEPLFLALLFPTLILCERAAERGDVRTAFLAGLLIGVLAMVRTLGVFALPGAGLVLLLRRRWGALIALGVGAMLFLVPWQLWVGAYQGEMAHPLVGKYGSYGAWLVEGYQAGGWDFAKAVVIRNAQDIDSTVSYMLVPVTTAWPRAVAFVSLLFFMLVGTKRYTRNAPVTAGFLACYILVVMLWPFEPNRFFLAIWPLFVPLVWYGIVACWTVTLPRPVALPWRGAVAATVLLMTVGYMWYNGIGYTKKWWVSVQRTAGVRARPTVEWVARHTAPTDVVSTEDDLIIYLYSGRKAVPTSTFTAVQRVRTLTDAEDVAAVEEIFDAFQPNWFIVSSTTGVRTAKQFASRTPPVLRQAGETPHVMIYQRLAR